MKIEIQEARRTPNHHNEIKKTTAGHILVKLPKVQDKENMMKLARGKKQITCKGKPSRCTSNFSEQTLWARRGWSDMFNKLQDKNASQECFILQTSPSSMREK